MGTGATEIAYISFLQPPIALPICQAAPLSLFRLFKVLFSKLSLFRLVVVVFSRTSPLMVLFGKFGQLRTPNLLRLPKLLQLFRPKTTSEIHEPLLRGIPSALTKLATLDPRVASALRLRVILRKNM
jgi:hypothetical protein